MSLRKLVCILICVVLLVSIFTGCVGKGKPSGPGKDPDDGKEKNGEEKKELEKLKLTIYMVGDEGSDKDLILGEINKVLSEKINTTLEMKVIPTPDVDKKYPLIFTSGEDFDFLFAAGWAGYKHHAANGGFLELTDELLEEYAPQTAAKMKRENWAPAVIDGKRYMIPRTDYQYNPKTIGLRGDLRKKYDLPEIKSIDDYELFLDTIAQNEKDIIPYADNNSSTCWLLAEVMLNIPNEWAAISPSGADLMFFKWDDQKGEELLVRESTPEYLDYAKKMLDWRKKGYWSNSALTATGSSDELFKVGKGASFIHHSLSSTVNLYNELQETHPEWEFEVYDATFGKKLSYSVPIAGIALSALTKHPERSLMAIELLRNDRELYDIAQYGIAGKHYELTSEGNYLPGPDISRYGHVSYYGLRTAEFDRLPGQTYPGYDDIVNSCKERSVFNPLQMFTPAITDEIKNEFAAAKDLFDRTRPIMNLGFTENPEKTINEYLAEMEAIGIKKIENSIIQQAKDFINDYLGN